jgi:hypothetical protein
MENNVSNIVNKVISEEINKRIDSVRNKIFENKNMKKSMCSECGSNKMYEGECIECGYMMEGEIQELGGMEDGHPKLGKERLPKRMSPEEIEKLLRGDDKTSSEDDDYPTKPGFIKKRMSQHSNRKHNDGEVMEYSFKDELENNFSSYEEFCSQYYNMDDPRCQGYYHYTSKLDDESGKENSDESGEEIKERLYGNQRRIDKNKNGRIDREDFKMLRGKKQETEIDERLHGNQKRIDKNKNNRIDAEDFKMLRKESVYEVTLDNNERFRFNESEIVDVIENIILEEKKKSKSKTKPTSKSEPKAKNPIKLTKSNQDKSKKENDDYIESVVKKMKDYLKDGSKGNYEMNPKHFPKGNGELGEMGKKAYKASTAVEEYVENFTAAALENLDYDDIKANEEWVEDNVVGSTRTGNNPEWANAVETDVNKKRNKIRKDNLLAKMKKKAYNKAPQPVNDEAGENTDKASKIMMQLESENERKVMSDMEKIKNLMDYGKKTQ